MNFKELTDLYVAYRFDKTGTNKINPNYYVDMIKEGYKEPTFISNGNSEFFTFEKDDTRFFIFIGSNETKDWLYNFFFSKRVIPYNGTNPKIKVHAGFFEMYLKIRSEVLKYATKAQSESKKIIMMGHSLGSAIATLAALDVQYNVTNEIECLVTGTPRVGNKFFRDSYNKRVINTTRITLGSDLIAKLPPSLFGFQHVSKNYIHLGSKFSWTWIKDHNIKRYKDYL